MELSCRRCNARFRTAAAPPLSAAVRVACPACGHAMLLRPAVHTRAAVIADEPRPFRTFLADHLGLLGFAVTLTETGDAALAAVRRTRAELAVVNVYLKGKLGVEVAEQIKNDLSLADTRVVLIGALFRANRFRANPVNLYGADEYIEEQIPEKELENIIRGLFPGLPGGRRTDQPQDDVHRLARLILSDIIIYHPRKVAEGIRDNTFFDVLRDEIEQARRYFALRGVSEPVFDDTVKQFVSMKRDELVPRSLGS